MINERKLTKETYKPKEVATILNVTTRTLRNYEYRGKLKYKRNEYNRRYITKEDLIEFVKSNNLYTDMVVFDKRDVVYARVSSNEQKQKGDLDRQAVHIVETNPSLVNPIIMKEVGSGLNDKRKQLQSLINMVEDDMVNNVYVTYRDRLTRFGFNYLEEMFKKHNVSIIVCNNEEVDKSANEELVEDMMSLIASFSGKLYGLRSKKNTRGNKDGD